MMAESALTVLDWKTSSYVSPEMVLQTAGGYFGATHVLDPEDHRWREMTAYERPEQAAIIHVSPEGVRPIAVLPQTDCARAVAVFAELTDGFYWLVKKGLATIPANDAYFVQGTYLPSVTYILSHVLAKPGLLNWAYEVGVAAGIRVGETMTPEQRHALLTVRDALEAKTLKRSDPVAQPWVKVLEQCHESGYSPNAKRDAKGVSGTRAHKLIGAFLEGRRVDLTDAPAGITGLVSHFADWSSRARLEPKWTERKVANLQHGWAGTLDCLGQVVVDTPAEWMMPARWSGTN